VSFAAELQEIISQFLSTVYKDEYSGTPQLNPIANRVEEVHFYFRIKFYDRCTTGPLTKDIGFRNTYKCECNQLHKIKLYHI
jgi:hypothetical protein